MGQGTSWKGAVELSDRSSPKGGSVTRNGNH
jgi:hypothetical protein